MGPAEAHRAGTYAKLNELRLRSDTSMGGYSRDKFPHWSDAQEYGWRLPSGTPDPSSCDVRDAALIRDGRRVRVGSGCYVSRGRWFDPYTGNVYYRPSDIDIDHMVPSGRSLANRGISVERGEAGAVRQQPWRGPGRRG